MWSSEPREGLAAYRAKEVPSFLSYFKTLSIGPPLVIGPLTSRSAVKRSTDWANPAWANPKLILRVTGPWSGYIAFPADKKNYPV